MEPMVKSDNNGSYIIDKNIWRAALGLIAILLGVVAYGGQSVLTDVKENTAAIQANVVADQANSIVDAIQSERMGAIKEQLDRIERLVSQKK